MKNKYFAALKEILAHKIHSKIVLLGAYNLFLHNISVTFNDLDFITDDEGVEEISKIFNAKVFLDSYNCKQTIFKLDEVEVHVVSIINNFLKDERNLDNNSEKVIINELEIQCATLESELKLYKRFNRPKDQEKIKLIDKKLNAKDNSIL